LEENERDGDGRGVDGRGEKEKGRKGSIVWNPKSLKWTLKASELPQFVWGRNPGNQGFFVLSCV